jgi:hypothetical protein
LTSDAHQLDECIRGKEWLLWQLQESRTFIDHL